MAPAAHKEKINLKDKIEDGAVDLSLCDIQDVPVKEIASFKNIHTLDLSNNHISTLPKNFSSLTNLIKLDLSKNQLRELPDSFGELVKLRHLDLYKNHLRHLPLSFHKLHALKWLDLKDNPLVPAIQKVAGPCFDARQCQTCAREIVKFYGEMQNQVEQERQVREAQRQKSLEMNALKTKQIEKKKKKEKKEKVSKQVVHNGNGVNGDESNHSNHSTDIQPLVENKSHTKHTSYLPKLIGFSIITLIGLVLIMFILCSLKLQGTEVFQSYVVEAWQNLLKELPTSLQEYGKNVENNILLLQAVVLSSSNYLIEMISSYDYGSFLANASEKFSNTANVVIDTVRNYTSNMYVT